MGKIIFDRGNENRPYLAVNAIILKKIKGKTNILLGKRKNVAGAGNYYPPGGHVKVGEKLIETLIREVKEECDLDVKTGEYYWTEEAFKPNHHVILYYKVILRDKNAKSKTVEPNKCEGWGWFPLDSPPRPLWHTLGDLVELLKKDPNI